MRTLGVSILGLTMALALNTSFAADDKAAGHDHHAQAFDQCAKACGDCARACDSCAHHCAHMLAQGKKEHLKTLQTCQDCASHCSAAACITARKGPFSDLICTACAEACARCGKECEKFPEDAHMKQCAQECRKCEKACREMLKHTGAASVRDK
ncbi:MAG TPA: four-helix bundle copper-binding protein [Gemmataceae bacterium]|nr:four-helix bundle copper-binding protein [Gemmataceae bacterium]